MQPDLPDRQRLLVYALLFEGGMGAVALGIAWAIDYPIWREFEGTLEAGLWGLAATVPMFVLFTACLLWPVGPIASIKRFSDEVITPLFRPCTILDLALISVVAGFGEELFFRGFLQTTFENWWGPALGLAAASAIFGLMHPLTPSYLVLAAIIGLYLGWTYQVTGNLLVPTIAHGFYDFIALIVLSRKQPDHDSATPPEA